MRHRHVGPELDGGTGASSSSRASQSVGCAESSCEDVDDAVRQARNQSYRASHEMRSETKNRGYRVLGSCCYSGSCSSRRSSGNLRHRRS